MQNVVKTIPAGSDFIYKSLAFEATTAAHRETEQRIRLAFLGEERLITDLNIFKSWSTK